MCKYNFNPRPLDKITSKVEIDFKRSKKDRKKAFKEVLKETEIPKDCNCLKCQKDKTPPASRKGGLKERIYNKGKSEGRKDVLEKVQNIITAIILPLDLIVMRTTHTEASHRIAKYQVGILKRLSRELKGGSDE